MGSLKSELLEDMKTAMKAKDKKKLSAIRMVRAAIKNEEINQRKELDDQGVIEVLSRQIKQLKDSIPEYKKSGKEDTINEIKEEIEILSHYLPQQMNKDEIEQLVDQVIDQVSASNMSDLGKVMGVIMPKVKGKADGKLINSIVTRRLKQA